MSGVVIIIKDRLAYWISSVYIISGICLTGFIDPWANDRILCQGVIAQCIVTAGVTPARIIERIGAKAFTAIHMTHPVGPTCKCIYLIIIRRRIGKTIRNTVVE